MKQIPQLLKRNLIELKGTPTGLNEVEQLIINYIERLRTIGLSNIDEIRITDGIYPYYDRFLQFRFPPGLYVMDSNRFYTPIDTGHYGLRFMVSVPKETTPVYAFTTFRFAKIFYSTEYIVIFVGCIGTTGAGGITVNRFLSDVRGGLIEETFAIIPVPGVKPLNEAIFTFIGFEPAIPNSIESDQEADDFEAN
jgi:hypothetical protein